MDFLQRISQLAIRFVKFLYSFCCNFECVFDSQVCILNLGKPICCAYFSCFYRLILFFCKPLDFTLAMFHNAPQSLILLFPVLSRLVALAFKAFASITQHT